MTTSFSSGALRTAIREVMEGAAVLPVRTVPVGLFKRGAFAGRSVEALQAMCRETDDARNRFDVRLSSGRAHALTPLSTTGSYRIDTIGLTIDIVAGLPSEVEDDEIDDAIEQAVDDMHTALEALKIARSIETTQAGESTNVAGGCLTGPSGDGYPDASWDADWGAQLFRGRISAAAIVHITQEV